MWGANKTSDNGVDTDDEVEGKSVDRRGALRLGGLAAAGVAGAAIGSAVTASPADASTGNMQFGAGNDAGSDGTELTSTSSMETLAIENTGDGRGLVVNVDGAGKRGGGTQQ